MLCHRDGSNAIKIGVPPSIFKLIHEIRGLNASDFFAFFKKKSLTKSPKKCAPPCKYTFLEVLI